MKKLFVLNYRSICLLLAVFCSWLLLFLGGAEAMAKVSTWQPRKYNWGYGDARTEVVSKSYWVYIANQKKLPPLPSPDYFGQQLKTELRDRYKSSFGYTEAEIGIDYADYVNKQAQTRGTLEDDRSYQDRQRSFGRFAVRRFLERRLDSYFLESPKYHKVYEVKDRLSRIETQAPSGWKMKANYNIAGNYLDIKWIYPRYVLQWTSYMENGIGTEGDHRFRINREFDHFLSTDLYYVTKDKTWSFVCNKRINTNLSWQWQVSYFDGEFLEDQSSDRTRHYLGLSYRY